jgi:glycosyltransferase involved in cell wall biosynthesis
MRILHVFRTPVGGLFRHVRDLVRGQAERGHEAGIVCDSTTGGGAAASLLGAAAHHCALGIGRIPISRLPGFSDIAAARAVAAHARSLKPDIIHCHGAKGGLHGRLAARWLGLPSLYTAHGGSLHYERSTPGGMTFLAAERFLARLGSGLHFVCHYESLAFAEKIGIGTRLHGVVHNGLWPEEFRDIPAAEDAADVLFIGDMRHLKGVDVLLEALAICNRRRRTTAVLAGDGPDLERFKGHAAKFGLSDAVHFPGRLSAVEAFRRGRALVVPSRAESFPYVVLEAAAAAKPLIATRVGGIPEVVDDDRLVAPGDSTSLAERIASLLAAPAATSAAAAALREKVRLAYGADRMVDGILDLYRRCAAPTDM